MYSSGLQDVLIKREVRLAAAIENMHAEELRLDEKQKELDEVQAVYDVLMQQRQVITDDRLTQSVAVCIKLLLVTNVT